MDQHLHSSPAGVPPPIALSADPLLPSDLHAPARRVARFGIPEPYVLPWELGTLVFLGALLASGLSGWLAAPALGGVLAAGGGALLLGVVFLKAGRPRHGESAAAELPARSGGHVIQSAFVCSQCAEYTPPPDWEALLRETRAIVAATEPMPRPASSHASASIVSDLSWSDHPLLGTLPTPEEELVSVPETSFVPPSPSFAPAPSGAPPELAFPDGRFEPTPSGASLSISGGHRPVPSFPRPELFAGGGEGIDADLDHLTWPWGEGTIHSTLDHWIVSEAEGIVALARDPAAEVGALVSVRRCASCKGPVSAELASRECPDCRRPICDPCKENVVEHDGSAWCGPCAVNRLSAEFLGVLEEPEARDAPGAATLGFGN